MRAWLWVAVGVLALLAAAVPARAETASRVVVPPPLLPAYEQAPLPAPGYAWIPGYWAWSPELADYFWVAGYWILPPRDGLYWTPGYWTWVDRAFVFIEGYWSPAVGFYGGVNYGYGYGGLGFTGARWANGVYVYNRAVTNIVALGNVRVYAQPAPDRASAISYNGGPDGVRAQPTLADKEPALPRLPPRAEQRSREREAAAEPSQRLGINYGAPPGLLPPRPIQLPDTIGDTPFAPPPPPPTADERLDPDGGPSRLRNDVRSRPTADAMPDDERAGPPPGFPPVFRIPHLRLPHLERFLGSAPPAPPTSAPTPKPDAAPQARTPQPAAAAPGPASQ